MTWIKLLSLFTLVAALFAAQGFSDRASAAVDRSERAAGAADDLDGDDAPDATLPPSFPAAPTPVFTGRDLPESRSTPATSPHGSRIFRPPIRVHA